VKVPLPFFKVKIVLIYVRIDSGSIYLRPHFDWFLNVLHLPRGKKEQKKDPANEEVLQYLNEDRGEMKSVRRVTGLLWRWWST